MNTKLTEMQEELLAMMLSEGWELEADGPMPGDCSVRAKDLIEAYGDNTTKGMTELWEAVLGLIHMGLVTTDDGANPYDGAVLVLTSNGFEVAGRLHNW